MKSLRESRISLGFSHFFALVVDICMRECNWKNLERAIVSFLRFNFLFTVQSLDYFKNNIVIGKLWKILQKITFREPKKVIKYIWIEELKQ